MLSDNPVPAAIRERRGMRRDTDEPLAREDIRAGSDKPLADPLLEDLP